MGGEGGEGDAADEDYVQSRMKGAGYDSFDTMMASVRRKEHRKRRLGSLLFALGGDARLAVQVTRGEGSPRGLRLYPHLTMLPCPAWTPLPQLYKTVSISKKPAHTWLLAQTNDPLKVRLWPAWRVTSHTSRHTNPPPHLHHDSFMVGGLIIFE